ncbi:tRNA pseudouridine(55) synthase TruB [Aminipila butyrica]|uniref:tRNA pseudouridine synthase B n=1 Tax=Aminipila butyrica TaxID=433296 RepID=A0A858BU05_9FIRM|nr:tRNA pseudouridine(55) synthase TruB [Aminipila butyrica]QIB69047.1 tRNA pseudouridine(55) synthase TruB [Aminipila butyrica]
MIEQGIINVNKPKGYTSHDCVNVVRSLTGIKRVGHTGTLDPMAEGVLPVCIGSAARIMEYLDMDLKTYTCQVLLGLETDTLDIWGQTVSEDIKGTEALIGEGKISEVAVRQVLEKFKGVISQIPPKYSALKVKGKKLYEYARAGEVVEISSRRVYIKNIQLVDITLSERSFTFEVTCSKGTYVRSMCRDIGQALGCKAVMSGLVRTASGAFNLEQAVTMDQLKALRQGENIRDPKTGRITSYARALPEELNTFVVSVDFPLVHFGEILVRPDRVKWFCDGGAVQANQVEVQSRPRFAEEAPPMAAREEFRQAYKAYTGDRGEAVFLGVAFFDQEKNTFKADKVFGRG